MDIRVDLYENEEDKFRISSKVMDGMYDTALYCIVSGNDFDEVVEEFADKIKRDIILRMKKFKIKDLPKLEEKLKNSRYSSEDETDYADWYFGCMVDEEEEEKEVKPIKEKQDSVEQHQLQAFLNTFK
jgi:hypothetical protein